MHSTYGFLMGKASSYFVDNDLRPFIISRSSHHGFGKYGSLWLGDNWSTWEMLKYSISGIFQSGMYGIPFSGADICGFLGNTTAELCTRWYQAGAFYPFARNHNDLHSFDQEPYQEIFNEYTDDTETTTYSELMKAAAMKRYAIHQYYYTHMHRASTTGTPAFKPLFYNYGDDANTFTNPEYNFLIGDDV